MHIKRFEGPSMKAVLAEIRAELGEDALILSSRSIRKSRGAFGLMAKSCVEVQAAVERQAGGQRTAPQPERNTAPEGQPGGQPGVAAESGAAHGRSLTDTIEQLQREVQRLQSRGDFEEEMRSEQREID